jgi:hypothetical protein
MKYSEYEKLTLVLEQQGLTVNDLVVETTGQGLPINEAEPKELATQGMQSIGELKNPFLRKKLTNAAKKLQNMIGEKIINTHYEAWVKDSQEVMNKVTKLIKEKKTPEDIVTAFAPNKKLIDKAMDSRYNNLEQAISKLIETSTTKVNSMLAKKNLSDNVKMNLENYWTLLSTQVFQNAWSSIVSKQADYIKQNIGEENAEAVEKILKTDVPKKQVQAKAKAIKEKKAKKTKTTAATDETKPAKPDAEQPAPAKPVEKTKPATEPATETKPAPAKPAVPPPAKPAPDATEQPTVSKPITSRAKSKEAVTAGKTPATPVKIKKGNSYKYEKIDANGDKKTGTLKIDKINTGKDPKDTTVLISFPNSPDAKPIRMKPEELQKIIRESVEEPTERKMVAENLQEFLK